MSKNEAIELIPVPGGRFDRFMRSRASVAKKLPKDPNEFVDAFVDQYGVDMVANMSEVDIGDYVYQKGIIHSQNMNVGRNIPWIEDGLKAVERRVLYIMFRAKLYNGKFDKVAGVSGDMIKEVHPHGEQSANDTIYRMGRTRTIMLPYITASGNFGNMDDMRPAAPRYASASLSPYAMDCFFSEIGAKRPIYDVKDNYKYSGKEPVFLTSKYPNMLLQWNQGIGKGAASWLGAFNSRDLFKAALKMLDDPNCKVDIYPDTPVPVDIINKSELKGCFDKKSFKVKMRAQYELVDDKKRDQNGKVVDIHMIVFTSLPLSVTGATVKAEIQKIKLADKGRPSNNQRLPEVVDINPVATNKTPGGIRLIVEYEKGYDPEALVEKLFKCTSLAKTVGVQYMLVTDNRPDLFTPREILNTWISYRYDQKRRYYHQLVLKAAKDRSRLEAICKILESKDNTDKAIAIIRASKSDKTAIAELMKAFDFSEFQAYSVIQLKLQNLPKMNIGELVAERDEALATYKKYRKLLAEDNSIKEAIREDLEDGLRKYGRDRMASLYNLKDKGIGDPNETKTLIYSDTEYFSLLPNADYKLLTDRAGKACRVTTMKNDDRVLIVAKSGKIAVLNGFAFNQTTNGISMTQFGFNEVAGVIPITKDSAKVVLITSSGYGKVMQTEDITKSVKSKITLLAPGDKIVAAIPIADDTVTGTIAMWSESKMYCAKLEDFPLLKRNAAGNRIFKFELGTLLDACYVPDNISHLLVYAEYGYMKAIPASVIKYSRKKPQGIDMSGKAIMGVIPFTDNKATAMLYGWDGVTPVNLEAGKMIHITVPDTKDEFKFRMGTTIGVPVKVLKKGRNEFYQFVTK